MYQRLYYHLIWTTLDRKPLIDRGVAEFLCRALRTIAAGDGGRILELGMVQTHVHLLLAVPLTTNWTRLVQRLKGTSSYLVNRDGLAAPNGQLRWARGYSIHTVSPRALPAARRYLASQPQHHPEEAIEGWGGDHGRENEWREGEGAGAVSALKRRLGTPATASPNQARKRFSADAEPTLQRRLPAPARHARYSVPKPGWEAL